MVNAVGLAQAHMATQVRNASAVEAALGVAFDKGLNPADLDASFPTYLRTALSIVFAGHDLAAKVATDYYGEARKGAGYEEAAPLIAAPQMNLFEATQALLLNGPVSIKKQLASGIGFYSAVAAAKEQTLGAGKRLTLAGGRDQIINLSKADEKAVAWARVSDGQPCHFCAMLVSRGPVYQSNTVHFKAHNRCGCNARPVFESDEDGGWSPDAKALRELWDTKGGDLNSFRSAYNEAVNDPSSPVFKTFTDKVAKHVSSPAIIAARRAAAQAYDVQRAAVHKAEEDASSATTKAEQEAAEAEAKAAAKEAAKIKKWQGKPAPVKPVEPSPATTVGDAAFDPWLEKVKKRYTDFANAHGNPKNDLTKSLNWPQVEGVIKNHDKSALTFLKSNNYIDKDLYDEALAAMKAADAPIPGAGEAYKKALASYKRRMTTHKRNVADWREVNGITSSLKGMDAAKRFDNDFAGVEWANKNLKVAAGVNRDAIKTYTGSAYSPWNDALRAQADASKIPEGRYGPLTKKADAAFKPTPTDIIVNRGTNWNEFAIGDSGKRVSRMPPPAPTDLIGTVQTNYGYMSTSVGKTAAFSSEVQMKILVPEGHGTAWAMPYSQFSQERELLLERGTTMFIHNVYQDGHRWTVEAEIIPKDADPKLFAGLPTAPASQRF